MITYIDRQYFIDEIRRFYYDIVKPKEITDNSQIANGRGYITANDKNKATEVADKVAHSFVVNGVSFDGSSDESVEIGDTFYLSLADEDLDMGGIIY